MGPWKEVAPKATRRSPSGTAALLRWLPALAIVALLWLLGHRPLAIVVLIVSSLVTLASARSERLRHALERVLGAIGRGAAFVVGGVLQLIVFALVFVPVHLLARLFRRDPLTLPGARHGTAGWLARPGSDVPPMIGHTFAAEGPAKLRTGVGRVVTQVPLVVGAVAVLLAVDVSLGAALASEEPALDQSVEDRIALATADEPWFADYRAELEEVSYRQVPFVLSEADDRQGEHITITDGLRRTYEPDGLDVDVPTIAVFGGSTVWGEGQRDLHTIPSELARLAERDGLAIRVQNHARRGDTNFAEVQRMERVVALGDPVPDLVVFLDGPDDVAVQTQRITGQPSHYGLTENLERLEVEVDDRSLWQRYLDASLVNDVVGRVKEVFAVLPAEAQSEPTDPTVEGGPSRDAVADAVDSVYRRGLELTDIITDGTDVAVRNLWLPTEAAAMPRSSYSQAAAALPESVDDLSDALDGAPGPVYLDGVHVNEAGARLIALAVYERLRPDLEALAGSAD